MARDEAGDDRKGGVIEDAEQHGEGEQERRTAGNLHQDEKRERPHEIDRGEQRRAVEPVREVPEGDHAGKAEGGHHPVGGGALQRREAAGNRVGDQVDLDHAPGREAADREPAGEEPERPLAGEPGQHGAEAGTRAAIGTGPCRAGGRIAPPDQQIDGDGGHGDGRGRHQQAGAPSVESDQQGEQRHQRDLAGGAARYRHPGGKPQTAVEMGRDRGRDQRGGDRGEAGAADDADEQHQLPGFRHRRCEPDRDRGERHADGVNRPRAVPVDRQPGGGRDQRHRGQHHRSGGGDQAVAPAQILLEVGHQKPDGIARGDRDAEHQEQRANHHPALAGRACLDVGRFDCGQGTPVPGNPPDSKAIIEGPRQRRL